MASTWHGNNSWAVDVIGFTAIQDEGLQIADVTAEVALYQSILSRGMDIATTGAFHLHFCIPSPFGNSKEEIPMLEILYAFPCAFLYLAHLQLRGQCNESLTHALGHSLLSSTGCLMHHEAFSGFLYIRE